MERNFFRRVETCFPVKDPFLKQRVEDDLAAYLADNTQAWVMDSEGAYHRVAPPVGADPVSAQSNLLNQYSQTD